MYQNGHYGAALLFISPVGGILIAVGLDELAFLAAVALAMVPDLDQRISGVTHRGPTHGLVRFSQHRRFINTLLTLHTFDIHRCESQDVCDMCRNSDNDLVLPLWAYTRLIRCPSNPLA